MNPYEVLGVNKNATPEEIKKVYRKKAMVEHPDKGGDEAKFKELAEAYEILSDPAKKQQFDTFGSVGNNGGGFGGSPFGGFDDFLSQVFGGTARQKAKIGGDVGVTVQMSLLDILKGAAKSITFTHNVKCDPCSGRGGADVVKCNVCGGSGQRMVQTNTAFGVINMAQPCNTCNSSGYIVKDPCNTCKGSGVSSKTETVNVTIPAGVMNGMQLTMPNHGHAVRDGITGNLFIRIEEIPDNDFKREKEITQNGERITNNLLHDIWISISDAVLGTSKIIKAPLGDLKFNIESGCESGKVFKFNGKGIPNMSQDGRNYGNGDMLVNVLETLGKYFSVANRPSR